MIKKPKFDESADSDDLQALFDSIAAQPAEVPAPAPVAPPAPAPASAAVADGAGDNDELQALFDAVASAAESVVPVVPPPPAPAPAAPVVPIVPVGDASGDNDELQALFDAVAFETEAAHVQAESVSEQTVPAETAAAAPAVDSTAVFNRIGQITRQLHNALRELGLNKAIQEAAKAMPDARQRLDYIAQMTEQAASRVLNAVDVAQPLQDRVQKKAALLHTSWDKAFAGELSADAFRLLSIETRDFLAQAQADSQATNAQLLEIMMAQDFQDLTGQVIKRILHTAQTLETQLLQVLIEAAPPAVREECTNSLMNGPVTDGKSRDDVVTSQEQVDDLLESLGF